MDGTVTVLNPLAENLTEYLPGFSSENLYVPVLSVVAVRDWPVPLFVAVTVAPLTTPPD
jgi:hypothetical protein